VRDCQHVSAGLRLVVGHPLPELFRVVAAQRLLGGEGLDPAGAVAGVTEDHVPVKVVAAGVRRPLVADERREPAGLVGLLGRLDRLRPGAPVGRRAGSGQEPRRHLSLAEAADDLQRRRCPLTRVDHLVPPTPLRKGHHLRVAPDDHREEAHPVGVIGDHQEVERTGELRRLAGRGGDLPPLGEEVRLARPQAGSERSSVHRVRGVQVGVPEERADREVAPRRRRVVGLLRKRPLRRGRIQVSVSWASAGMEPAAMRRSSDRRTDFTVGRTETLVSGLTGWRIR
jgi:hypothetical protein